MKSIDKFIDKKKSFSDNKSIIKPSVFTVRDEQEKLKQQQENQKYNQYQALKTKKYTVYGNPRTKLDQNLSQTFQSSTQKSETFNQNIPQSSLRIYKQQSQQSQPNTRKVSQESIDKVIQNATYNNPKVIQKNNTSQQLKHSQSQLSQQKQKKMQQSQQLLQSQISFANNSKHKKLLLYDLEQKKHQSKSNRYFKKIPTEQKKNKVQSQINMRYTEIEADINTTAGINLSQNYNIRQTDYVKPFTSQYTRKNGPHMPFLKATDDLAYSVPYYYQRMTSNVNAFLKRTNELKDFDFSRKELLFPFYCQNDFFLGQTQEIKERLYKQNIVVTNRNLTSERLTIKMPEKYPKLFTISMNNFGLIAPSQTRQILIQFNYTQLYKKENKDKYIGEISDSFQLISKQQIYTIPFKIYIVNEEEFNENKHIFEEIMSKEKKAIQLSSNQKQKWIQNQMLIEEQQPDFPNNENYKRDWEINPQLDMFAKKKKKKRNSYDEEVDDEDDEDEDEEEEEEEDQKEEINKNHKKSKLSLVEQKKKSAR